MIAGTSKDGQGRQEFCGDVVRPVFHQARVAESGRTAPKTVWNNYP